MSGKKEYIRINPGQIPLQWLCSHLQKELISS